VIADRIRSIQAVSGGGGGGATDPYYAYRSLILNFDGNFNDSSPVASAVTAYGDAQIVGDGVFGTVASFDGNGDVLTVAGGSHFNFGSSNFTIECWIKSSQTQQAYSGIFSRSTDAAGAARYLFCFDVSGVGLNLWVNAVSNSAPRATHSANIHDGNWHHIAAVRSSTSYTIYVDGVAGSSSAATGTIADSTDVGHIATDANHGTTGTTRKFIGEIGPLRISPWAEYTSNFTPSQDLFPAAQQLPVQDPWYDKTSLILNMDGTPGSTTFEDDSPNALAVTAVGDAQIVSDATFGTVASFDGAGDNLQAGVSNDSRFLFGTGDFTVELWIYVSSLSGIQTPINNYASTATGWNIQLNVINTNNARFSYGDTTVLLTASNTIGFNQWNHLAVTRKGSTATFWINGVQSSTASNTTNILSGAVLTLGRGATGSFQYYNGLLGPTRITKGLARDPADFLLSPPSKFPTLYNPYIDLPVAGAALWLDAADDSTLFTDAGATNVIKSGDQVYQWSDKSGNNRHAIQTTSANRPTWLPPASGQNGLGALAFNGSQWTDCSNFDAFNFGTGDFTVELWLKPTSFSGNSMLLGAGVNGFGLYFTSSGGLGITHYGVAGLLTTSAISTTVWSHVAVSRSGTTLRVFINGVATNTITNSSNFTGSNPIRIGWDAAQPTGNNKYNGQIQNLIIYNGQALYTSNFIPWMS
jgi:hypothetical protein